MIRYQTDFLLLATVSSMPAVAAYTAIFPFHQ